MRQRGIFGWPFIVFDYRLPRFGIRRMPYDLKGYSRLPGANGKLGFIQEEANTNSISALAIDICDVDPVTGLASNRVKYWIASIVRINIAVSSHSFLIAYRELRRSYKPRNRSDRKRSNIWCVIYVTNAARAENQQQNPAADFDREVTKSFQLSEMTPLIPAR